MNEANALSEAVRAAGVGAGVGRGEARSRLRDVRATVASLDGTVEVVISATGELRDLRIAGGALRRDGERAVAGALTDALRRAQDLVIDAGRIAVGRS
ncbi:YbaB/EbfC family nucleoid-associated protein [Dactylosporangium sp. NPDC051485]|uniref:YbaB/EbfC family nucleoid-associated protein n=1 Tax=Dactylosporangium sp. NPDC051485 TaxID=3154846 RepID=UPI00342CA431